MHGRKSGCVVDLLKIELTGFPDVLDVGCERKDSPHASLCQETPL